METAPAHLDAPADASIIFDPDRQPLQPVSPSHRPGRRRNSWPLLCRWTSSPCVKAGRELTL